MESQSDKEMSTELKLTGFGAVTGSVIGLLLTLFAQAPFWAFVAFASLGVAAVWIVYVLLFLVFWILQKRDITFIRQDKPIVSRSRRIQKMDLEMSNRQNRLMGSEQLESEIETDRMLAVKPEELSRLDD